MVIGDPGAGANCTELRRMISTLAVQIVTSPGQDPIVPRR
jgi:hypothetical protein